MSKKDTTFLRKLGEEVRKRRKDLGWSQEQLAEKAELTFKHISKIERALTSPSIATINRLADAMGITLVDLLSFSVPAKYKPSPEIVFEQLLESLKNKPKIKVEYIKRLVDSLSS